MLAVVRHRDRRLILEILSYSWQLRNDIDTKAVQKRLRADPRELKNLWCMKASCREYHLFRSPHNRQISSCGGQKLNSSGLVAFEQNPCDSSVRQQVVVGS